MKTELLLGCGSNWVKRLNPGDSADWSNLTTLDYNASHSPDVVHDLRIHPLPLADEMFDEVHAYEVLEHLAPQGDYKFFFSEFSEYHRILKPDGIFCASVPAPDSPWALGDPSHTRIFHPYFLTFLSQAAYQKQVGNTSMSDFRDIYKVDFAVEYTEVIEGNFYFILRRN